MVGARILQIILILIILGVIVYLLRLSYVLKLEKRIARFAINTNKVDDDGSILDKFKILIEKLVLELSKILGHSEVLTKYATKYNKYISYEAQKKKNGMFFVAYKFLLAFLVMLLGLLSFSLQKEKIDIMVLLIAFLLSFILPDIYLKIKFQQKRKRIENDLLKAIIIMNNAFKSGRNIMQAVEVVKDELDGPIQDEFKKIYLDITYGLSLDVVFERFYERVKLEDAKYITSSLTLLNKTGGDIIKVFSLIERSFFDKKNLKNELNSLTATSRFVFKLLVLLPFIFIMIIALLNPLYFKPLVETPLGIICLVFIILLYTLYILIIKRVLEVKL